MLPCSLHLCLFVDFASCFVFCFFGREAVNSKKKILSFFSFEGLKISPTATSSFFRCSRFSFLQSINQSKKLVKQKRGRKKKIQFFFFPFIFFLLHLVNQIHKPTKINCRMTSLDEIESQLNKMGALVLNVEKKSKDIGTQKDSDVLRKKLRKDRDSAKSLAKDIADNLKRARYDPQDKLRAQKLSSQFKDILENFERISKDTLEKEKKTSLRLEQSITGETQTNSHYINLSI